MLSDSVPPDVNMISSSLAPMDSATLERESESASAASCPKECRLEALPNRSVK
jgi:hypothetical protein